MSEKKCLFFLIGNGLRVEIYRNFFPNQKSQSEFSLRFFLIFADIPDSEKMKRAREGKIFQNHGWSIKTFTRQIAPAISPTFSTFENSAMAEFIQQSSTFEIQKYAPQQRIWTSIHEIIDRRQFPKNVLIWYSHAKQCLHYG